MPYPTVFHLIAAIFQKTGITSLLIGGYAVNHYKVSRQTADIDFLVSREDFDKVVESFKAEGYGVDELRKVFARLKSKASPFPLDIDFLFAEPRVVEVLCQAGEEITIAGQKFRVPSLRHLIALKLHAIKQQPQARILPDLADILAIIRANKIEPATANFKELCLAYGTEDLYRKLLDATDTK